MKTTFLPLAAMFLIASTAEAEDPPLPDEEPGNNAPVCKSDAGGVMRCSDPSTTNGDGDETLTAEEAAKKNNYFHCKDIEPDCPIWSTRTDRHGTPACQSYSAYMTHYCPLSCETCEQTHLGWKLSQMLEGGLSVIPFCQDNSYDCSGYAQLGECEKNPEYMRMFCPASCGICSEESNMFGVGQRTHEHDTVTAILIKERLDMSIEYMYNVRRNRKYKKVRDDCLNKVPDCTLWAAQGECEKNEGYMKVMCAPACLSCDYLGDTSETCIGLPENTSGPLWKPGDLNQFFETIIENPDGKGEYYQQFEPKALSRPKNTGDGLPVMGEAEDGPWVVLLEKFLSDEEADRIVQIGKTQGFERSRKTIGAGQAEFTEGRTSANTWCKDACMEDPLVKGVLERIAAVTRSTLKHSEHLQLLKYEERQFYQKHHDFVPYQLDYPCGARLMTLFLYLNDVEEGGNTSFPDLGISVKPKKGAALLWPSVLDHDPMARDTRMEHEAEAVVRGVKYGANAWIHSEDFQTPFALKCLQ